MNFKKLSPKDLDFYTDLLFKPLESAEELKNWAYFFLNLDIPQGIVDLDSTSAPIDAIWTIYKAFQENTGEFPGAILLSSRESLKTFSASILECLLLLHNRSTIAHAAATEAQSSVGLKYLEKYLSILDPLIRHRGWENVTQNKRTIEYKTPEGDNPFIKVLICTPKGMNSLHASILFLDELDLADPVALKEARNIVGYSHGRYGMTVYLSTRKYSHGNMQEAVETADEKHFKLLQWNILDVTERCHESRHKPELPREDRYTAKVLPFRQLSVEDYNNLPDPEKSEYRLIKDAYAGCLTCPLLPVCKKRLAERPVTATGGFYKPIPAVIQKFRENDTETAEAQILCWRPGSEGLVFPRFSDKQETGNVLTVNQAYKQFMGFENLQNVSFDTLIQTLMSYDIPIYVGVDWGWTNKTAMIVGAKMPNGEFWILDTFAMSRLEFSDILNQAIIFRDRYSPIKWIADTAAPQNIATFRKNGMMCADFKKDVWAGIEAVRSSILNSNNERKFKVLLTENNKQTIKALQKHAFKLDTAGNSSGEPDNAAGIADICDTLRYLGQVLFPIKGPQRILNTYVDPETQRQQQVDNSNAAIMRSEIVKITGQAPSAVISTKKKGGFKFTI